MLDRKKHKVKTSRLRFYFSALGIILFLLFYVGLQMTILSLEGQVRSAKKKRIVLERDIENYEIKTAELRKGSRIKRIAQERLGMEMPLGAPETLF